MNNKGCSYYKNENANGYVVEYKGDFLEQIGKVDYACGTIINEDLSIIYIEDQNLDKLLRDVPSIVFVEARSIYTLQDIEISPSNVNNIVEVKRNPYLNLTGRGVVVGIIDSGIDYLNDEFIRPDKTSRIISIWDQSIVQDDTLENDEKGLFYIGEEYSNEKINEAILAKTQGANPYDIVPSKDEVGHGTKMASIIGSTGYNKDIQGVANDCSFLVVKLAESLNYKRILSQNNINNVPVYNNTEIISAIEYLRRRAELLRKPIVIFIGVGSTTGSHDGYNITTRYITSIARSSGVVFVSGTGNNGNSEGHYMGVLNYIGDIDKVELSISRDLKFFEFYIWIQSPNRASLNIVSPTGEETSYLMPQLRLIEKRKFYKLNTEVEILGADPESFTGQQMYYLKFNDIKKGIWTLRLKGEYIANGRFDIWLADKKLLPEGTRFLRANDFTTLNIPSTAKSIVTVSFYDGVTGAVLSESGKGFDSNYIINPDISVVGTNILTVDPKNPNKVVTASGSSVATAITAGVSALILQWAVVDQNDINYNTEKVKSLLIYSAIRENNRTYPNEESGYGKLNFEGAFDIISGSYKKDGYREYSIDKLYIRIPNKL